MTIIVYRDGVLAADSFHWAGAVQEGSVCKVIKTKSGVLGAACGLASDCIMFRNWLPLCERRDWHGGHTDDFSGILIDPDGRVSLYDGGSTVPLHVNAPFYALGAGRDLALGALHFGASAIEAAKLAIDLHAYCGGDVNSVTLHTSA